MTSNIPEDHRGDPVRRTEAEDYRGAPVHRAETENYAAKEAVIGTDRQGRSSNVSWGAIFAGVVTFLAVTVLLSLVTTGIGLTGEGAAAGIWSIVALALALAAAGYVAGALAVRSGMLHGFLTWATSLVVALVLTVWLSVGVLGAVGNAFGQVTNAADVTKVVEELQGNVDENEVEDAQQQAVETADDAQPVVWWTFVGMLLGALIAAGTGILGASSVTTRAERVIVRSQPL